MPTIQRKHPMVKVWGLLKVNLVALHVSDPHRRIDFILELKSLTFVLSVIILLIQICFKPMNACRAFCILDLTSKSLDFSSIRSVFS